MHCECAVKCISPLGQISKKKNAFDWGSLWGISHAFGFVGLRLSLFSFSHSIFLIIGDPVQWSEMRMSAGKKLH